MRLLTTSRRFYQLEQLERRYFLTIVPIDAMAGVPFEGIVATNLRLPAHATGLELVNVMINGQWDYAPTAIKRDDGTFDLQARMTPQRAGTEQMTIWFRNDRTGGWDLLEQGEQTVKANHFNSLVADAHFYDRVPGTRMREPLATFATSLLTQSLDDYVVEIDWLGQAKQGRLVREDDGSVGAYVDDAYVPIRGDGDVFVTIRLADAAPDSPAAGYARVWVGDSSFGMGIGMFYGAMTSDTAFRIDLPNSPKHEGSRFHYFIPAAESDGWESTFTADLIWNTSRSVQPTTPATVVRNADGSYVIVGELPADRDIEYPMMKIHETIHRPAVDGQPAQTYTATYVGSFEIAAGVPSEGGLPVVDLPTEPVDEVEEPTSPEPVMGFIDLLPSGGESRFSALAARERFAFDSRGFDSVGSSLFSNSDDDSLVGDDQEISAAPLPV